MIRQNKTRTISNSGCIKLYIIKPGESLDYPGCSP